MTDVFACSAVNGGCTFLVSIMIPATCAADARVGAVFSHVPDLVAIVTYHTLRGVGCYLGNRHIVLHNFREGWSVKSDDCSVGLAYSLCAKHLSLLTSKPPQDVFIRLIRFDFDDSACRVRAVIRFLDLDGDCDDFAIVTALYVSLGRLSSPRNLRDSQKVLGRAVRGETSTVVKRNTLQARWCNL